MNARQLAEMFQMRYPHARYSETTQTVEIPVAHGLVQLVHCPRLDDLRDAAGRQVSVRLKDAWLVWGINRGGAMTTQCLRSVMDVVAEVEAVAAQLDHITC